MAFEFTPTSHSEDTMRSSSSGGVGPPMDWCQVELFKCREVDRLVEEEKLRLEAAINACDRLKKSLFARIEDLTRTTCETSDHTDYLKRASANMMGRYSQDVHLSKPHPFSVSGELEYTISRIDDLYEQRVHLDRLTRSVRNSVLSVAFLETGLSPDHADDEVIIDLNKMTAPKQFDTPPSFFLASWALHDMIVDQVYRHPLPANAQETGLIQENSPTRSGPLTQSHFYFVVKNR